MSKLNPSEYKNKEKFDVSYFFINVRYNIEIIYKKDITCDKMHDLRIYDTFNTKYLPITKNEISNHLKRLILSKIGKVK